MIIQTANFFGHEMGAILVEVHQSPHNHGYFQATVNLIQDVQKNTNITPIHSKSAVGFFVAVANLCKRLDKKIKHPISTISPKWQVYLLDANGQAQPIFRHGYLLVRHTPKHNVFIANLMAPPGTMLLNKSPQIDDCIRNEHMNSVEDSVGQTYFGSLENLCRKFHYYGFMEELDSMVLNPLAADFFLHAAWKDKE